ncbi:MAG: hypothetical protein MUC92_10570 [Fimbriimonadaceae bacterium]|nr:hypothetical protein [Fimbriimonadaceae bacterium]
MQNVVRLLVLWICLVATSLVFGQNWSGIRAEVTAAKSLEELRQVEIRHKRAFAKLPPELDQELTPRRQAILLYVMSRESLDKAIPAEGNVGDAKAKIAEIKRAAPYYDPGVGEGRNWLGSSLGTLSEAFQRFFEQFAFRPPNPNFGLPQVNLQWVIPLMWGVLGLALLAFLIWLARKFNWAGLKKKSKGGGILGEDEEELAADEWLARADQLEREGNFRAAVRCLYLACLMRFSDAGVAAFIRSETNWEHLYRIRGSTTLPEGIDFRTSTTKFDLIWYGERSNGQADVAEFREIYKNICMRLGLGVAA